MKDFSLQYIFQDWQANKVNTKGKIFSFFFRTASLSSGDSYLRFLFIPARIFYKIVFEWVFGIEIPSNVSIGKGLRVYHLPGIVVHSDVEIGKDCTLRQSTTIGNKTEGGRCPVIGDNVNIGAHVCIIGDISIGDNAVIGAGSVVVKSVPANAMVAGNPARVIKYLDSETALPVTDQRSLTSLNVY